MNGVKLVASMYLLLPGPKCHNSHAVTREAQATYILLAIILYIYHRDTSLSLKFNAAVATIPTAPAVLRLECLIRLVCHFGAIGTLYHCYFTLVGRLLALHRSTPYFSANRVI